MRKAIFSTHIQPPNMPDKLRKAYNASLMLKGAYASRIGADLIVKNAKTIHRSGWQSLERLEMCDLFDKYERMLYVDADILVKPDSPDIFEVFNDDNIHMLNESPPTEDTYISNWGYMESTVFPYMLTQRADFDPPKGFPYYNAGVMLCSRTHRKVLEYREKDYFESYRFEQDYINYYIWKYGFKVDPLPIEWNAMHILLKDNKNYMANNHFIHYIGRLPKDTLYDDFLRIING
jgi:lipopolysaccharide biosynthesis glycosyltransferase